MKKIIGISLICIILVSVLTACSSKENKESSNVQSNTVVSNNKVSELVEIEYLIGNSNKKITITNKDQIKELEEIFINANYNEEVCDGIASHTITFNGTDKYYFLESCKHISNGENHSTVTDTDIEKIKNIMDSNKN